MGQLSISIAMVNSDVSIFQMVVFQNPVIPLILGSSPYGLPVHGSLSPVYWIVKVPTWWSNQSFEELSSRNSPKHPRPANQHGSSWWNLMVSQIVLTKSPLFVDEMWNPIQKSHQSHPFPGRHRRQRKSHGTFTSFCVSRKVEARECRDCSCWKSDFWMATIGDKHFTYYRQAQL